MGIGGCGFDFCSQGCSGVFLLFLGVFFKLFLDNTQIKFGNNYRTGSPLIGVCGPCHAKYF